MGAWGAGLFDNDDALDLLGEVEDAAPDERAELLLGALDEVLLAEDYVEAPEMSAAVAAAAAVGAVHDAGAARSAPGRPEWLTADAFPVGEELIEKSRRVLRSAIRSHDNEWWELWGEAGLTDEIQAACQQALAWLGDRDD